MFETDPTAAVLLGIDALDVLAAGGPPGDLPAPVPDFVGDVHAAINSFVDGSVESLGDAISSLTPGGSEDAPGRAGSR